MARMDWDRVGRERRLERDYTAWQDDVDRTLTRRDRTRRPGSEEGPREEGLRSEAS